MRSWRKDRNDRKTRKNTKAATWDTRRYEKLKEGALDPLSELGLEEGVDLSQDNDILWPNSSVQCWESKHNLKQFMIIFLLFLFSSHPTFRCYVILDIERLVK
jgi:hypothetical protein